MIVSSLKLLNNNNSNNSKSDDSIRTSNQHRISFACAVIVEMMSEFEKKTKQV
jgi:hypothetical protein